LTTTHSFALSATFLTLGKNRFQFGAWLKPVGDCVLCWGETTLRRLTTFGRQNPEILGSILVIDAKRCKRLKVERIKSLEGVTAVSDPSLA
jgi:hypothetical protein